MDPNVFVCQSYLNKYLFLRVPGQQLFIVMFQHEVKMYFSCFGTEKEPHSWNYKEPVMEHM